MLFTFTLHNRLVRVPRALADFVCIPLVHNFVTVFPGAQGIKELLLSNYQ